MNLDRQILGPLSVSILNQRRMTMYQDETEQERALRISREASRVAYRDCARMERRIQELALCNIVGWTVALVATVAAIMEACK